MSRINILWVMVLFLFSACNQTEFEPQVDTSGLIAYIEDAEHSKVAEYTYNPDGTMKESWTYNAFFMSNKKEEYEWFYNSDGMLSVKEGFEPGNMIMSSMTGAMDKDVSVSYAYDSENRLIELVKSFDYEEELLDYSFVLNYEYPEEHIVIQTSKYEHSDSESKTEYLFDDNGNIIEVLIYNVADGALKLTSKEQRFYDDKKVAVNFEPTPKSKNNMVEKKFIAYNYDDNGNQLESYSSVFTYEYEYNSAGYPTKETEIYPNEVEFVKYYFYIED